MLGEGSVTRHFTSKGTVIFNQREQDHCCLVTEKKENKTNHHVLEEGRESTTFPARVYRTTAGEKIPQFQLCVNEFPKKENKVRAVKALSTTEREYWPGITT